jgi:hypothetical protein
MENDDRIAFAQKESYLISPGLNHLSVVVKPSSLFEKSDRRFNDVQVGPSLLFQPVYQLSSTIFFFLYSPKQQVYL